jgi:hypothetical protein
MITYSTKSSLLHKLYRKEQQHPILVLVVALKVVHLPHPVLVADNDVVYGYKHWSILVIRGNNGTGVLLFSKEGVT